MCDNCEIVPIVGGFGVVFPGSEQPVPFPDVDTFIAQNFPAGGNISVGTVKSCIHSLLQDVLRRISCARVEAAARKGLGTFLAYMEGLAVAACNALPAGCVVACDVLVSLFLAYLTSHLEDFYRLIDRACHIALETELPDVPAPSEIEPLGSLAPTWTGSPRPFAPGMKCGGCQDGVHKLSSHHHEGAGSRPLLLQSGTWLQSNRGACYSDRQIGTLRHL